MTFRKSKIKYSSKSHEGAFFAKHKLSQPAQIVLCHDGINAVSMAFLPKIKMQKTPSTDLISKTTPYVCFFSVHLVEGEVMGALQWRYMYLKAADYIENMHRFNSKCPHRPTNPSWSCL